MHRPASAIHVLGRRCPGHGNAGSQRVTGATGMWGAAAVFLGDPGVSGAGSEPGMPGEEEKARGAPADDRAD